MEAARAEGQARTAKALLCAHCGMGFKKAWFLTRHERVHTQERPFPCRACGRAFTTRPNRDRHEKSNHGLKPLKTYPCGLCAEVLSSEGYLAKHLRETHPAAED